MVTLMINQKNFEAEHAGIGYLGMIKAELFDRRALSVIAPEIEGSEIIIKTEDGEETGVFEGYTRLMRIFRVDDEVVSILLAKPEEEPDA